MTPIQLTQPAIEPLSLAEAKAWLRLDSTDEDSVVQALITAARLTVEREAGRLLINQTWKLRADFWPLDGMLRLPLAPLRSVTAIRVYDAGDTAVTVSSTLYRVDASRNPPLIVLTGPVPQPGRCTSGIEIEGEFGFGATAAAVPEPLRHAMRLLVARWFENRGDAGADAAVLPLEVTQLVAPYRRARL